ncbi:hypothetical protein [Mesorhizobium sp. M2A.F.Ca.ET.067.02.1.1]|uniref:hypothetical protein n=1 Tax=Mesorhizobium sp. M2A.F.Ca.ET.067.02.1.1 TaxID=2496749 RepID=UPI000FD4C1B2|nr:hypothetical protein [Mesorhizobium sp. M2A.F.Ca.ET.067.02.1.1]RUW81491.1 hypothetical protein EOA28_00755 [Mesorhizobium sp. M2A.F.Ca.ET.067.02.1.1]TIU58008.1 MAG: hypothetical protein E5W35_06530 [Mesorhizobium sp.]
MTEAVPIPTTIEGQRKAFCDIIVERAVDLMQSSGAPAGMILDRLITYAAAQACTIDGSPKAAHAFRHLADQIDAGVFHSVTGEGRGRH